MDGLDGSLGLVEYRAPYGANNQRQLFRGDPRTNALGQGQPRQDNL